MNPASPVIPKWRHLEITFAKDQPEYRQLPALRLEPKEEGVILTRWTMSWRERWRALLTGSIYVQVMTFNVPLQPLLVSVGPDTGRRALDQSPERNNPPGPPAPPRSGVRMAG